MNSLVQLFVTPDEKLNSMCWSPSGFPERSVMVIEGEEEALKKAHAIIVGAIIAFGTFPRKTKIINELSVTTNNTSVTAKKMVGSSEDKDIQYLYSCAPADKIGSLVKMVVENSPKDLDYILINNLPHVTVNDIQFARHVLDSRESQASLIMFSSSIPDGGFEIADVYLHVTLSEGVLWFSRPHFDKPEFLE